MNVGLAERVRLGWWLHMCLPIRWYQAMRGVRGVRGHRPTELTVIKGKRLKRASVCAPLNIVALRWSRCTESTNICPSATTSCILNQIILNLLAPYYLKGALCFTPPILAIFGHLAIRPSATNMGKWGIPKRTINIARSTRRPRSVYFRLEIWGRQYFAIDWNYKMWI